MRFGIGRTTIRGGAGKRRVDGKSLRLADEVRYIQRREFVHAHHPGRTAREARHPHCNRRLTCEMEPDQDAGYREECRGNSMQSTLILAGLI